MKNHHHLKFYLIYFDYYNHYFSQDAMLKEFITVKGEDFKKSDSAKIDEFDGVKAVVLDPQSEWVEYEITVPKTGTYGISIDYYQLKHKEKNFY